MSLDGNYLTDLSSHTKAVYDLALIGENFLASSSGDMQVIIWDLITKQVKFNLSGHTDIVYGLKLVNVTILASGSQDKTIRLWNVVTGQQVGILQGHTNTIYGSVDLFETNVLITGSWDKQIKLWNINMKSEFKDLNTSYTIQSLAVLI